MKRISIWSIFILSVIILVSCSKDNPVAPPDTASDDSAINNLLTVSVYTDTTSFINDNTTEPYGKSDYAKADTFPSGVMFARRITAVTRSVSIVYDSSNSVATATISLGFTGQFFVDNDGDTIKDPYVRDISDQGTRKVWLRKVNGIWRIWGVSPLEIVSSDHSVTIDSIQVLGCVNGPITILPIEMSTTRLRENLPIFEPGVTATVNVWSHSVSDSTWPFLHRWVYRLLYRRHIREPLYREPGYFTRSWGVSDSILVFPAVRHAAMDVISGSCLFGDSSAVYSARAWCLPYIVKSPTDSLP
ncbi:MAG: hypothetical protein KJ620_06630 [Candidatus Edwardsbacteria bacterium]|nr:hypothetical protein [Candidatus Edwardsbacteria bacterium]MBU1576068.1 hypothetical protein [Candidatus Edwardsbacteria bacterium]MBU2463670.1 hypothetical protein [Candidatus Edwardsbacteria bacterium]MBU2594138.1 hypothetical protein [Candidatus Edwardsbacteria bacterium]